MSTVFYRIEAKAEATAAAKQAIADRPSSYMVPASSVDHALRLAEQQTGCDRNNFYVSHIGR